MEVSKWIGKAVSIECDEKLGVFQGIIRGISEHDITIVRAFRNGVPLRKQNAEVTLRSKDIVDIKIIPSHNTQNTVTPTVINKPTPVKQPNFMVNKAIVNTVETAQILSKSGNAKKYQNKQQLQLQQRNLKDDSPGLETSINASQSSSSLLGNYSTSPKSGNNQVLNQSVAQFFGNLIPSKVEVLMGAVPKASSLQNYSPSQLSDTAYGTNSPTEFPNSSSRHSHSGSSGNGNNSSSFYKSQNITNINGNNRQNRQQKNNKSVGGGFQNGSEPDYSNGYNNCNGGGGGGQSYQNNFNGFGNNFGNCNGNSYNYNGQNQNGKKRNKQQNRRENGSRRNQAFGNGADDPLKNGDFDFEGNLALFDKRAIWNNIEAEQKIFNRDKKPQVSSHEEKYRHDENILASKPLQLKQIESGFDFSSEFVTDEGLVIPTIPLFVRTKIEMMAVRRGYSLQRQYDLLSRGASDLALSLLGGARRFTPNNVHQWPKIVIVCEKSMASRCSNIGAAVGRTLASHGLTVMLYLMEESSIEQSNSEISLYKATGNSITYSVEGLIKPDLIILLSSTGALPEDIRDWMDDSRAPILAIDPPPTGVQNVSIKYSIFPILPINGMMEKTCGKLFLCNVGLPDKFYNDGGLKYKSPFGHKYVIPIYLKD